MQRGGPQYKTIKYFCAYCKCANTLRVEVPKPRFGGRNPQVMAPNRTPEPRRYTAICACCGLSNQVS